VPKYDAFGREIGEDTLEGLGGAPKEGQDWREEAYAQPAEAQPAEEHVETGWTENAPPAEDTQRRELAGQLSSVLQQAATTRPQTVRVRRSGSGRGCLIAFVVVIAVFGAAIGGIVNLVSSIDIDTGGLEEAIKAPVTQEPPPKGLEPGSLMRRAAVADFLRQISADESVKLTNLHLTPARNSAQVLTSEGRLRSVAMTPGDKLERVGPDSGAGFDAVPTIPISKLDPGAPQRLARRGAREHGIPITELQYAVPSESTGQVVWVVYFTRARYVIGNAKGRFERAYNKR
jgi:hypothetical protein